MNNGEDPWLVIHELSKKFGGEQALDSVDLDIRRGEVHGLVGANGAGKSTLIRCLAGVVAPDHGHVSIDSVQLGSLSTQVADDVGLAFIHQELNLVPHFSATENILLGAPKPKRMGLVDWKASRLLAREAAERIGIRFSLDQRVDELGVGDRWLIMIAKALVRNARLIAMDEPTASLSDAESHQLFSVIRDLAKNDVSILYVSHRLDEVLELSDRITVFRDGKVAARAVRGDLDKAGLVRAIVGHDLESKGKGDSVSRTRSEPILEAKSVSREPSVRGVSFVLHKGEVLGFGGLVGAGRTELARLAFGVDKLQAGHFELFGKPLPSGSIPKAIAAGIALVPEERRSQGLLLEKSVAYNMNIAVTRSLRALPWLPFISEARSRTRAKDLMQQLAIKTPSVRQRVGRLSGGNQQKTLLARWLTPSVKVLFLDEPSRGVDVGAREEIHKEIRSLSDRGVGTVVISSDNEELVSLCDRVIVMREGRVTGELIGDDITERRLIELSYDHTESPKE